MASIKMTTISDIADAADVSPATVARVVHNRGYVSEEKRGVIERVISELGYVPNKVARGLRNSRTNLIGHVLPLSLDNPLFTRIGASLEEAAYKAGYHILTVMTQNNPEKERAMIEDLCGLMVEAIIFTTQTSCDTAFIRRIAARGISIIMIERPRDISDSDIILLDSYEGARLATEHIVECGHQKIAFIGRGPSWGDVEKKRYDGFLSTLSAHGLSCPEEWIRWMPDYHADFGLEACEQILSTGDPPSCIFATSDLLACGVLQCLHAHGLRVPGDVSLVGYDNTLSSLSTPKITSIDLQPEQVGIAAIDMILERTEGLRVGSKTVTLSPILIDRGSVRAL